MKSEDETWMEEIFYLSLSTCLVLARKVFLEKVHRMLYPLRKNAVTKNTFNSSCIQVILLYNNTYNNNNNQKQLNKQLDICKNVNYLMLLECRTYGDLE